MSHIQSLHIEGYRGIKQLQLQNIEQINLLIGKNNIGKTSVLEAVELVLNPGNASRFAMVSRGRDRVSLPLRQNISILDSLQWTFPLTHFDPIVDAYKRDDIELHAVIGEQQIEYRIHYEQAAVYEVKEQNEQQALQLVFNTKIDNEVRKEEHLLTEKGAYIKSDKTQLRPHRLVAPADHRTVPISASSISRSILSGEKNTLVQLLKNFDNNIEGIEVLAPAGERPYTYFKHKLLGFAPISIFGDGVRRVLTVASALIQCRNGVLLIDEIETAIHAQLFNKFFNWLVQTCVDFNVQLIATTHSIEALDAILSADKENLEHFSTYRLQKNNEQGNTEAKRFIGEDLYALRFELGQDVR